MEILFPDDVYSGGGALPQYFNDLGPSIIVRESNLHTFGSEKLKKNREIEVVYHLPQIPGNSCCDENDKRFLGSSHWKIPETNGNSEKVVPFSRLGRSEWKLVYNFQVS